MSVFLGVDIGGTNVKIAAVSATGRVLARGLVETAPRDGVAAAFGQIHAAARTLVGRRSLGAVGIGCAGLVDARTGMLRASPNLQVWSGTPLLRIARRHFGVPVVVDNDATCAAYGEASVRRARDLVMITLGTGVGGGIVVDGAVVRGASGFGGEVGHMPVDPAGPRCRCGHRGCLEAYAGSYGIVAAARAAGLRTAGTSLTVREVMERARRGDRAAAQAVRQAGERLGLAVASLMNALNPAVVVIGGGVSGSFDLLAPHVRRMVRAHAFREIAAAARLERSRLGNDAATVGAALLARNHAAPRRAQRPPRSR